MSFFDHDIASLQGEPQILKSLQGKTVLAVNVASRCGLTPQYEGLERLHETYADRGFSVVGFPCNQFLGQEPGTNEEIQTFCALNYGVAFPMFDKVEVNGEERHPLFAELTQHPDTKGEAGDILWNFEKFVVSPEGKVVARFRPKTLPDASEVVDVIEAVLPD